MSAEFALAIALLSACSMVASYFLGRESMRSDIREYRRKREDEDFED